MKGRWTVEYVIAVVALLVAVGALLYAREVERATFSMISDQREYTRALWTVHEKDIDALRDDFAAIEQAQMTVQAMIQGDVEPPPWPPVHRTTSKPRPEVRNIDPTPDRSGP